MATIEIETVTRLVEVLATHRSLSGVRLQGLDLRTCEGDLLARRDVHGLVVLGGILTERLDSHLRSHGAVVFPRDPGAPTDPYRSQLYSADELYAGLRERGYLATPDARAYAWSQAAGTDGDVYVSLLQAIHDDAINDALHELLSGQRVVGVMGGHDVRRGSEQFRQAAHLGQTLARAGLIVATGGGPGAMEAANCGASAADSAHLDQALTMLATAPSFADDIDAWAAAGFAARDLCAEAGSQLARSVGVPTWFYGHEPPNVFADHIAKFFSNAIREDTLLDSCTAGVIVLPGAAGTVQEIFQVMTKLYYAKDPAAAPPLVLVGRTQWTDTIPVWPVVEALAAGRGIEHAVHLVDDPSQAAAIITKVHPHASAPQT